MQKLLMSLLLSITLVQLCWAAVGPYSEHAATLVQHAGHHQMQTDADASPAKHDTSSTGMYKAGKKDQDGKGFCSSCEMQAGSLGYPSARLHSFIRAASLAPTVFTLSFSSHIPDHPEEPDWLAAPSRGVAARL